MKTQMNVHAGEILLEEFLEPLKVTPYRLAKSIKVQQIQISKIIEGSTGVSADMAIRLGRFFGNTPEFWMNLQRSYDLRKLRSSKQSIFDSILQYEVA
jgi:addiction module HigA family antidote